MTYGTLEHSTEPTAVRQCIGASRKTSSGAPAIRAKDICGNRKNKKQLPAKRQLHRPEGKKISIGNSPEQIPSEKNNAYAQKTEKIIRNVSIL
jgi:hypothetical protein